MSYEREEVKMETKGVVELKQASTCKLEAVIATLNAVDSDNDLLLPGSFGEQTVPFLWSHRQDMLPLGKARVREVGDQVVAEVEVLDQPTCDWLKLDFATDPRQQYSWGFLVPEGGATRETIDGQDVRVISAVELLEVSGVLRGASVGTRTVGVKSACCDACGSGEGMCADERAKVIEQATKKIIEAGVYGWRLTRAHPGLVKKVAAGAAALGVEPPAVWMIERVPTKLADVRTREDFSGLMCELHDGGRVVYVEDGHGVEDEARILGHELSHVWESHHGFDPDEDACEEFGRRFAAATVYGTRLPTSPRAADA